MKRQCLLLALLALMLIAPCCAAAKKTDPAFEALVEKIERREQRELSYEERKKLQSLLDEAKEDRLKKLQSEYVPKVKDYDNNTVCSFGPQFRKVSPRLTDEWYMFTPIDLSQDGTQTFDLIAGYMYVIGEVTVTVKAGKFEVDYTYFSRDIEPGREYYTIFGDYGDVTRQNLEQLDGRFTYGKTYDVAEKLGGDTDVILFVCNTATFKKEARGVYRYYETNDDREALRETMLEMIGK